MVRILCSSSSGTGHFTPLMPFIRSFLLGGHDVMVAGPPRLAAEAVGSGAVFWPFDDSPDDEMSAVAGQLPRLSRHEANRLVCSEVFGRLNTTAAVPRLRDAIDEWRPDLVLHETAEFGSALAAELHGIPHARVAIGLQATEAMIVGFAAAALDKLRREHGLPGDPDAGWLRSSPLLTLFPQGLEAPDDGMAAPALRFRDPGWAAFAAPRVSARPFVYITFGTVAAKMPHLAGAYREVFDAVRGLEVDVLLTVGKDIDPAAFGTPPPNVQVQRWANPHDVLDRAVAVVCHGGGGSTLGALAAGIPLVVVPLFAGDQFRNADRVSAVGAGLRVGADAAEIRSALQAVLSGPSYHAAARQLAAELASYPSTFHAADFLSSGRFAEKR